MIWLKKLSNLTEVNAFLIGFYLIGKKQYFPTNTHHSLIFNSVEPFSKENLFWILRFLIVFTVLKGELDYRGNFVIWFKKFQTSHENVARTFLSENENN